MSAILAKMRQPGVRSGVGRIGAAKLRVALFCLEDSGSSCDPSRWSLAMSDVSLILNVLWIVFGGLWMAAGWVFAAVIMAITIVGLPWARSALTIAGYTL